METIKCIQTRRTIRQYKPKEIAKDQLGILIDAARYAPSAGNLQNWRFIAVRDPAVKSQLSDACVQQVFIEQAPLVIVIVSDLDKAGSFYGQRGKDVYSRQNAAAAAQNIILAAHDIGLSSCFVSALDEAMIARALGLPENIRAEVVIPIGYADEQVPVPPRLPINEGLVFLDTWGNSFDDFLAVLGYTGHKVKKHVTNAIEQLKNVTKL